MLLWAFGRAVRGEPRMVEWDATERSVQKLCELFGRAGEERGRVAYPASALHGAGLWELNAGGEPVPCADGSVTERWFREHQPRCGLAGPVHELIRDSEEARVAAVGALVSTFFTGTGTDHVGLLTEVGLLTRGRTAGQLRAQLLAVARERHDALLRGLEAEASVSSRVVPRASTRISL
jgi:5-methylcytosine-specific restriction enzyme A